MGTVQVRKTSDDGKPIWVPHVTIQHPLQSAINQNQLPSILVPTCGSFNFLINYFELLKLL